MLHVLHALIVEYCRLRSGRYGFGIVKVRSETLYDFMRVALIAEDSFSNSTKTSTTDNVQIDRGDIDFVCYVGYLFCI
jgi:hypothetical protein